MTTPSNDSSLIPEASSKEPPESRKQEIFRLPAIPAVVQAEYDRRNEEQENRKRLEKERECLSQLKRDVGRRFTGVTLDSFQRHGDRTSQAAQDRVLRDLREFSERLEESVNRGDGLFLYGPCGTGKDHLAVALLAQCAGMGIDVRATNGIKLFGDIADAWRHDRSERDIVGALERCRVLLISDPALPQGLSESQSKSLYRLVSARYDRMLSTWTTVNVSSEQQAIERLSPQVYSRLIDGAIRLYCPWGDFRKIRRAPFS